MEILDEIVRMRQMTRFHLLKIPGIEAITKVFFAHLDRLDEKYRIENVKFAHKEVKIVSF